MPIIWLGWESWAAKNLTAHRRKKLLKYSAVGAFILANYLAFSTERMAKADVVQKLAAANARLEEKGQQPETFRHLTENQKEQLKSAFSTWSVSVPLLIASHNDDDSINLGQEISKVLKSLKLNVQIGTGYLSDPKNTGFYAEVKSPNSPSKDGKKFLDVMAKTGLAFKVFDSGDTDQPDSLCCIIFVAPLGAS